MEDLVTRRIRVTYQEFLECLNRGGSPEIPKEAECWTLKPDAEGRLIPDSPIDSDMIIEFEWEENR